MDTKAYLQTNIYKFCIVLLIAFAFRTPDYLASIFNNYGLFTIRYQKLWFFLLPGMFLISIAIQKHRISFKNIWIFLFFICIHYYMETSLYHSYYIPNFDLLMRTFYFFIIYFVLMNVDFKYYYFITKSTIWVLLYNSILLYLALAGVISFANIQFGFGLAEGRLVSEINLNGVSDQLMFGILILLFFPEKSKLKFSIFQFKIPTFVIIVTFGLLTFLNASRGSLLILLMLVTVFLIVNRQKIGIYSRGIILVLGLLLILLSLDFLFNMLLNVSVFSRLFATTTSLSYNPEGRYLQILSSWVNFIQNPVIGKGYGSDYDIYFEGITRSNFFYTQLLQAGGIILFSVYMILIYKMFPIKNNKTKGINISHVIVFYILILFIFRRPDMYLGLMAYLSFMYLKKMESPPISTNKSTHSYRYEN